jgi:hypothetical protein
MFHMPPMVDMAHSTEDMKTEYPGIPDDVLAGMDKYPSGLTIWFGNDELEKLDLDTSDVEVGDFIHLFCFAKVTSISKNETSEGCRQRIELQITNIACEDEDEEMDDENLEKGVIPRIHSLYK